MDIRSTVITLTILAVIAAIWTAVRASRAIQKGKRMPFYFKRRKLYDQAAGLILTALALGAFAYFNFRFGERYCLPLLSTLAHPFPHPYHYPHANHHADPYHHAHPYNH